MKVFAAIFISLVINLLSMEYTGEVLSIFQNAVIVLLAMVLFK